MSAAIEGAAEAVAVVPGGAEKVAELREQVGPLVAQALAIEVTNDEKAAAATEFIVQVATQKKNAEQARTDISKPIRDGLTRLKALFDEATAPLDEARRVVEPKLIAYRREQERIAEEARQRAEAEARAERERQEAEARKVREQAEAEARAAAEAAERASTWDAKTIAAADLTDAELVDVVLANGSGEQDARAELQRRKAARVAQEAAAQAQRQAEQARAVEAATASRDVVTAPPERPAALRSSSGSASVKKRWTFEITDEARVPREFLKVDEPKIREAIKAGIRDVPGLRIYQDDELAVRTS